MKNLVNRRANNRTVQSNNRLVDFVTPPITSRNLVVHRDLIVEQDSYLNGNVTFGGDVSVSGNVSVSRDVSVSGNVSVAGTLQASTFLPGQVINVSMLSGEDLHQDSSKQIDGRTTGNAFSYTYTPKTSNSYILYEYYSVYTVDGGNADTIISSLLVDGVEISSSKQQWVNSQGGGTRSSVLYPIVGRYRNESLSSKTVSVTLDLLSTDDYIIITGGNKTWLKITEIGR
jgi:hypothetical protein